MLNVRSWQRWSWDEIYTALKLERSQGEAFEVAYDLVDDPVRSGAEVAGGGCQSWDYHFPATDGGSLFVRDLGDRYAAYLNEGGPLLPGLCSDRDLEERAHPALMAAAGGFLVFLGSMWAVLEAAWQHLS